MDAKRRFRMATELLWFASASFGAGLLAAIGIAAVVVLLAQPAYAASFPRSWEHSVIPPKAGIQVEVETGSRRTAG